VSAEEDTSLVVSKIPTSGNIGLKWGTHKLLEAAHRGFQAGSVAGGVGWARWAEGSGLAIGQIAAEHCDSGCGESLGQGKEQWGLCVASGTVRQDQPIAGGSL
jgi:hypothetical protein